MRSGPFAVTNHILYIKWILKVTVAEPAKESWGQAPSGIKLNGNKRQDHPQQFCCPVFIFWYYIFVLGNNISTANSLFLQFKNNTTAGGISPVISIPFLSTPLIHCKCKKWATQKPLIAEDFFLLSCWDQSQMRLSNIQRDSKLAAKPIENKHHKMAQIEWEDIKIAVSPFQISANIFAQNNIWLGLGWSDRFSSYCAGFVR